MASSREVLVRTEDPDNEEHSRDAMRFCVGATVDAGRGLFYWTQKDPRKAARGRICRAGTEMREGDTAESRSDFELLFSDLPERVDLEIEPRSQALWWKDRGEHPGGNSLHVSHVGPGDQEPASPGLAVMPERNVATRHLHEAIGLALDVANRCVYACDLGGSVYCVRAEV
jgi:hypothetical protein